MNQHFIEPYGDNHNICDSHYYNGRPTYQQSTDRFPRQSTHQLPQGPTHQLYQRCTNASNYYNPDYHYSSYNSQTSGCNISAKVSVETRVHESEESNRSGYFNYQTVGVTSNESRSEPQSCGGHQSTYSPSSGGNFQNLTDQRDKTAYNFPAQFSDLNYQSTDGPTSVFPNIILYLGNNPKGKIAILKQSFAESHYGQLDTVTQRSGNMTTVNLVCAGQYLAEGTAKTLKEATVIAACQLIEKLQATNYTIVENNNYFSKSKVPTCVLNVDPSLKHIYRVVYLKNNSLSQFPYSVTGAVDYVQTEDDLWKYVEDHSKNHHKTDLFILNIEKSHRRKVSELCKIYNMTYKPLNGCSDRGAAVMAKLDLSSLFHELKESGGANLKYRLIPPGHPVENESNIATIKTDTHGNEIAKTTNDPQRSSSKQNVFNDGKEIVISRWIADNLIIMDIFNKKSVKETPKEILFLSVKDTSSLNEFIIEKKRDKLSGKITGSALIDMKLVGGATAYTEQTVKVLAAENALQNLKKYCYYIEGKPSYFGINGCKPTFLFRNYPRRSSSIYRIMDPQEVSSEEELIQAIWKFKTSHFQDLFLLDDIPDQVRDLACSVGMKQSLEVRWFDDRCICIYKKQRPKEVFKLLLSLSDRENEKYRLHDPPLQAKDATEESGKSYSDKGTAAIQNLFDFKIEHSHEPVYYNRLKNNEQVNREDGYRQKFQAFKRELSEPEEDCDPTENKQLWDREDRDHYKIARPRF